MDEVPCDLCGSSQRRTVYSVGDTNYGFPGKFYIVECRRCRMVYLNPRPSPERMAIYYQDDVYHPYKALRAGERSSPSVHQGRRAAGLTRRLGTGRVLDVGCGTGLFLVAMKTRGWEAAGVEPTPAAAAYARTEWGLDVRAGLIEEIDDSGSFDLVTFWEVLEHTPSPREVLTRAHHLLRPGGYLAASVPNWAGLERRAFGGRWIGLDAPRHLYHFTPRTLRRMLEECGFQVLSLEARTPELSMASNVLRLMGDTFLRGGASKARQAGPRQAPGSTGTSPPKRAVIRMTHALMMLPNALVNVFNFGSGIQALAQKC